MSKKKRDKIDKQLRYMKDQMERFLWQNFRDRPDIRVYANKELTKKRKYAQTVFGKSVHHPVEVDIEVTLLVSGKTQKVLETAFREALRIGLWRKGIDARDGARTYETELAKHGLPSYGGVAEMGKELHGYECSGCRKVWALKEKKLPKTKDPEQLGYITECCGKPFRYSGKKLYDNQTLQRIKKNRQ